MRARIAGKWARPIEVMAPEIRLAAEMLAECGPDLLVYNCTASSMRAVSVAAWARASASAAFSAARAASAASARDAAAFDGIVHRWVQGKDVLALLWVIRQMFDSHGSMQAFFLAGDPGGLAVARGSPAPKRQLDAGLHRQPRPPNHTRCQLARTLG